MVSSFLRYTLVRGALNRLQARCVLLNKGKHIVSAVRLLKTIMRAASGKPGARCYFFFN
jgi:hypothetical protein